MDTTRRGSQVPNTHSQAKGGRLRPSTILQSIAVALVVATFALTTPSTGSVLALGALRIAASPPVGRVHHLVHVSSGTGVSVLNLTLSSAAAKVSTVASSSTVLAASAFDPRPTPSDVQVISLIQRAFPRPAWHDAEAVAWCESKFRTTDIGFDSNGTHDRGLFQLNDGGTEQYLLGRLGLNPNNLALAFNPLTNVRAAALLYARDGWSQWSCSYVLA